MAVSFGGPGGVRPLAFVHWTGGGTTVNRQFGGLTISRTGAGDYTINIPSGILPTSAVWTFGMYSTAPISVFAGSVPSATAVRVRSVDTTGTNQDAVTYWAVAF